MKTFQKAWNRWKIVASVVGNYQGRAIVLVFYYTIMVPFGIGVRLFSDPLRLRSNPGSSAWLEREPASNDLDDARRQF